MEDLLKEFRVELNETPEEKEKVTLKQLNEVPPELKKLLTEYIEKLMNKVHVMRLSQLKMMLTRTFDKKPVTVNGKECSFDITEKQYDYVIMNAQLENLLYISVDGYVMTQGYYLMITEDKFFDCLNRKNWDTFIEYPMEPLIKKDIGQIKCMTIVENMLPISENFILTDNPWNVVFVTPEEYVGYDPDKDMTYDPYIYEIVYIPHKTSTTECQFLKRFQVEDKEVREDIKRIAVLEDANDVDKVPYIGFTNIVTEQNGGFKIIEARDNPWEEPDCYDCDDDEDDE